jgi:hypothetical protein
MRAEIEPTTSDTPTTSSTLDAPPDDNVPDESIIIEATNPRFEADDPELRLNDSIESVVEQAALLNREYPDEQLYLANDEFYSLQTKIIDRVVSLPTVTESSIENLPTVKQIGLSEDQIGYYNFLDEDRVTAINQQPIEMLLGDSRSGSLLAGRAIELEVIRGDDIFTVTFDRY